MENSIVFSNDEALKKSLLDQEIVNRITTLIHFLRGQGHDVQPYSSQSLEKLSALPEEKKIKALD